MSSGFVGLRFDVFFFFAILLFLVQIRIEHLSTFGNMPSPLRFRNVCFTVNNPGISKEDYLDNMLKNDLVRYVVIGDEVGEEGRIGSTNYSQAFCHVFYQEHIMKYVKAQQIKPPHIVRKKDSLLKAVQLRILAAAQT